MTEAFEYLETREARIADLDVVLSILEQAALASSTGYGFPVRGLEVSLYVGALGAG